METGRHRLRFGPPRELARPHLSSSGRQQKAVTGFEAVTASCTVLKVALAPHTPAGDMQEKASQPTRRFSADVLPRFSISS